MRGKTYAKLKRELLNDKRIRQAYDNLGPEFSIIEMIINRRLERGLSQKDLARKIGTKQSSISRLESGTYNPSLFFLQKISKALNARLKFSLLGK